MTTLQEEINAGQIAKNIINEPIFQEAFDSYRALILQTWVDTPMSSTETREQLYMMLKATDKVKQDLISTMETGKLAEIQLETEEKA